jgi:hypothetical protein
MMESKSNVARIGAQFRGDSFTIEFVPAGKSDTSAANAAENRQALQFAASSGSLVIFAVRLAACGGSPSSAPGPPDPTTYSRTLNGTANGSHAEGSADGRRHAINFAFGLR